MPACYQLQLIQRRFPPPLREPQSKETLGDEGSTIMQKMERKIKRKRKTSPDRWLCGCAPSSINVRRVHRFIRLSWGHVFECLPYLREKTILGDNHKSPKFLRLSLNFRTSGIVTSLCNWYIRSELHQCIVHIFESFSFPFCHFSYLCNTYENFNFPRAEHLTFSNWISFFLCLFFFFLFLFCRYVILTTFTDLSLHKDNWQTKEMPDEVNAITQIKSMRCRKKKCQKVLPRLSQYLDWDLEISTYLLSCIPVWLTDDGSLNMMRTWKSEWEKPCLNRVWLLCEDNTWNDCPIPFTHSKHSLCHIMINASSAWRQEYTYTLL